MFELLSLEIRRKVFHTTGSLIPVVYYFLSKDLALVGLSLINAILLLIEWLRLKGKIVFPKKWLRSHENKEVAGYIYFQMASLLSILLFEKTIAIASILMLALGDAASGLAGAVILGGNIRSFKTNKSSFKPLPIMVVMFVVCVLIGLGLSSLPIAPDMIRIPFPVYVAGAMGATLGDAIPLKVLGRRIDDNLSIPLMSGLFMTVVISSNML